MYVGGFESRCPAQTYQGVMSFERTEVFILINTFKLLSIESSLLTNLAPQRQFLSSSFLLLSFWTSLVRTDSNLSEGLHFRLIP